MRVESEKSVSHEKIVGLIARASADFGIREFVALKNAGTDCERSTILIEIADRTSSPLFTPDLAFNEDFLDGLRAPRKNLFEIASEYQHLVASDTRIKKGVFFTPPWLADEILKKALTYLPDPRTIIDPACGSGMFLLSALNHLKGRLNCRTPSSLQEQLSHSLFGVDIDSRAVEVSRMLLSISAFDGLSDDGKPLNFFARSVVRGNSIESSLSGVEGGFSFHRIFSEVFEQGGFGLVVGNPPFGLKRNGCFSEEELSNLKARYEGLKLGKANNYMVFIARGYELLRPLGILSYVTPNSWLGIRDGEALRRVFLSRGEFRKITVHRPDVFSGVSLESITFILQKGARSKSIEIERVDAEVLSVVDPKDCLLSPSAVIPLSWNTEVEEILSFIERNSAPLVSEHFGFDPKIALQVYAAGKGAPPQSSEIVSSHAFHSKGERQTPNSRRYLEGKGLKRYEIAWGGDFVEYGPWCAEHQPIERFTGPRLLIREITGKAPYLLQCSFVEEEFLYNRSILHILSKKESALERKECLLALLGVLNSKVASFLILFRGQKSQRRVFPKVLNGDLKNFPLPFDFERHIQSLAGLVSRRIASMDSALDGEIDLEVARAYGVPSELILGIDWALRSLSFTSSKRAA